VLALVLAGSSMVRAAPCAPRVELLGDPAAVAQVAAELARLGVTTGVAAPGCAAVHARVQLDDGGVAVAISDGQRRSEGRVVSDVALAATWLESWARDQVAWAAAPSPSKPTPSPPAIRAPADVPATVPPTSIFRQGAIGVSYEQAFTNDAAWWSGFGGHACVVVGGWCIGARVRYATQSYASGTALPSTRHDAAALATVSTGLDLARMSLAAELGAGVGKYASDRASTCIKPDPTCDPIVSPDCPPGCADPTAPPSAQHAERYTPRLAATLRLALPLFDHVWLDGLASLSVSPFAHADGFASDVPSNGPSKGVDVYALPGEPPAVIQLGVGLRIGAP
jgi:hypothetical protein